MKNLTGKVVISGALWGAALSVSAGVLAVNPESRGCPLGVDGGIASAGAVAGSTDPTVHDNVGQARTDPYLELHFRATGPVGTIGGGAAAALAGHPEHEQP